MTSGTFQRYRSLKVPDETHRGAKPSGRDRRGFAASLSAGRHISDWRQIVQYEGLAEMNPSRSASAARTTRCHVSMGQKFATFHPKSFGRVQACSPQDSGPTLPRHYWRWLALPARTVSSSQPGAADSKASTHDGRAQTVVSTALQSQTRNKLLGLHADQTDEELALTLWVLSPPELCTLSSGGACPVIDPARLLIDHQALHALDPLAGRATTVMKNATFRAAATIAWGMIERNTPQCPQNQAVHATSARIFATIHC